MALKSCYPINATVIQYEINPTAMESSPTMRSCPSFKFAARFIVSRHTFGAINGSKPSITRTKQRAAKKSTFV